MRHLSKHTSDFPFLDKKKAEAAFHAFVLPGIMNAARNHDIKRPCLHIVALKPGLRYGYMRRGVPCYDLPVLFEHSINKSQWENPYDKFARGKALITWRTRLSSREVILMKPHLLEEGDIRYWGSAIIDDNIAAASGVESHFDELFSRMTAATMCAEATHYAKRFDEHDDPPVFLPKRQRVSQSD